VLSKPPPTTTSSTVPKRQHDRLAIRELIDRSSDLINHQEWTALMDLFTSNIVWERLPPTPWKVEGRDAVHAFLTNNANSLDVLLYTVAATSIDVRDAQHASARSTMSELIRFKTGAALHVVGSYSDDFVKTNDGWRFSKRTIRARYEEDVAAPSRIFIDAKAAALPSAMETLRPSKP
jgi:hypothetical protein